MHSLSVLLSVVEPSRTSQTALANLVTSSEIVRNRVWNRVRVPCILAVATIRGQYLFCSELPIVHLLFEGGNYSRAASVENSSYLLVNRFKVCQFLN